MESWRICLETKEHNAFWFKTRSSFVKDQEFLLFLFRTRNNWNRRQEQHRLPCWKWPHFCCYCNLSQEKKSKNPTRDPDAHVVCAVTFQVIVESKVPRYGFIHWLAVAPDSVKAPASLQVWRRNGFRHFMFQLIIKYCVALNWCYDKKVSSDSPPETHTSCPPVELYLQVSRKEETSVSFYLDLGMKTLNAGKGNAFSLLPKALQVSFEKNKDRCWIPSE